MVANLLFFTTCNLIVEVFSLSHSFCFCFEVKCEFWNKPNLKNKFKLASEEIDKVLNIGILLIRKEYISSCTEWPGGKRVIYTQKVFFYTNVLATTVKLLACVASISAWVHWEKLGRGQKKRNDRGGGGKRRKHLPTNPQDFEKLRLPTNAASDWCGAGSVDYLVLETSIKPGMLCLRAPQIWSYLSL